MNFSRLYMQSWWEVPSIAYFCSLFRTAFDLLDFDIEELEEALLTDDTEDSGSSLLTELIVRLLNGCLGNNDVSAFNYQMYLRRLFRRKCQDTGRYNPFNTDIDFQFLPLRTKVEILYALCDFRLDAEDVFDLFKNLEAESLRVEPLGWDDNDSAYWYFYGTRLYREDILVKPKGKSKKKKNKESKRRSWFYGHEATNDKQTERVWQVVCFTEDDWTNLTEKFRRATSKVEKELHRSLSQNFLPEIPRLFQEKERLQRKRLLELPRRTSNRVLQKIKQKEEESKPNTDDVIEDDERIEDTPDLARENRAKRRNLLRSKSASSISSKSTKEEMPQKLSKRSKSHDKKSKKVSTSQKGEQPPDPPVKAGRKTNNSLASATGQILIPDNDEPVSSTRKKLKTSQIFSQSDEDVQTDMYKVLEQLTAHDDAWPFMDPVEEEYAPNYYAVIRRPMDLRKMEKRLDSGYYTDFSIFKSDFKLIVNNCRLYNGQDNEYTTMVDNLQTAFDRLTEKYIHRLSSSDEEIAVEFQIPTPSRKHKLKSSESQSHHKKKKRRSHSESGEPKSSSSDAIQDTNQESPDKEVKKSKESHKNKEGKIKKKHKSHHRHGKHSKNHKKNSHKSGHGSSSKSKHSKRQKHGKNKDKSGKKSKKKKSKHREMETNEVIKRSASQESIESSNRSRSASPLPSIHTPSPSPTELEQTEHCDQSEQPERLSDPEFFKDKYDKIKERRRNAAKEAWESLFDVKQKGVDKQKLTLTGTEKDKNKNLTETIEKLKAKNEKFKDTSLFNHLFNPTNSHFDKIPDSNKKIPNKDGCNDNKDSQKNSPKKGHKKNTAKNESASEALEEAVKDISKWLDDAPKGSTVSSPCASPAQTISTEEHENSRLDDDLSQSEKPTHSRKDMPRKRRSSREPKLLKRREIQRTIDRLQPGKSKGNLLTNITNKTEKTEEIVTVGLLNKARDSNKGEEPSPKLTLGSVLPTVQFTLGSDHNFGNTEDTKMDNQKTETKEPDNKNTQTEKQVSSEKKIESVSVQTDKTDAGVETEPIITTKPSQEKATPNLSAWFKAFGAPKSTPPTNNVRKKIEDADVEEKPAGTKTTDVKLKSPKIVTKYDSTQGSDTPNPEGGESPLPNTITTPRQRRTSTGSSMSERSSFSQDLDSPRHQISHTSPLIQSPASPRTEDFQKITYPIINGTVRAGFYQDTTSMKSSPEKSCSPREAPHSPFSPYSQHVYASNGATGSTTPHYFVDQNKSPLPTYTQNPPPYYDSSKVPVASKPRVHVDYTALSPDSYSRNQYTGAFAPGYTALPQVSTSNYSQIQQPPTNIPSSILTNSAPITTESKSTLFPVKKRTYNEPDHETTIPAKLLDTKELAGTVQNKNDYQKLPQPIHHTVSSLPSNSVDDIALALSEKSNLAKLNNLREKQNPEYVNRNIGENKELVKSDNNVVIQDKKKESASNLNKAVNFIQNDNIDMVNMGYMNPDDRKINGEMHEDNTALAREVLKHGLHVQHMQSNIEATAINLGINNQAFLKPISKPIMNPNNIPPAHMQDRSHSDISINQIIPHAHNKQYDTLSSGQTISNFSMNDIEQANKKLYACNVAPSSVAIDFGNWKMSNQIRKQDVMASDYSTSYNSNHSEKTKSDSNNVTLNPVNYNKNVHQQQYNSYVPRNNTQRQQDFQQNLTSELRIPNPRGLLKACDHVNLCSSTINTDLVSKSTDTLAKSQKQEKLVQNHPLIRSNPYKTPYSNHSSLIPQMLERYTNDERYTLAFAGSGSSIYHDKQFQMSQMFNKSMTSEVHSSTTPVSLSYSQPTISLNKDNNTYKSTVSVAQSEMRKSNKRKRSESKSSVVGSQIYHNQSCATDVLSSVKTSMMPGSAFNFGTSTNMTLGTGLYGDNTGFSIDANQIMAANYMVAAVAHQQRNNAEASAEKIAKPAHQNSSHSTGTFPFIGHSQVPAGYSFVGTETTSPLYQQYLQRHQEELLRQTGAQIMSLYPSGYPPPPSLSVRQPYDTINRPSWL